MYLSWKELATLFIWYTLAVKHPRSFNFFCDDSVSHTLHGHNIFFLRQSMKGASGIPSKQCIGQTSEWCFLFFFLWYVLLWRLCLRTHQATASSPRSKYTSRYAASHGHGEMIHTPCACPWARKTLTGLRSSQWPLGDDEHNWNGTM